jgi:hypothetical protein
VINGEDGAQKRWLSHSLHLKRFHQLQFFHDDTSSVSRRPVHADKVFIFVSPDGR